MSADKDKIQRYDVGNSVPIKKKGDGRFVLFTDVFGFDYSFVDDTSETSPECCPYCAGETDVCNDGTTECQYCHNPDVLPCNACNAANHPDEGQCDWSDDKGCTPFPSKQVRLRPADVQVLLHCLDSAHAGFASIPSQVVDMLSAEEKADMRRIERIQRILQWEYKEEEDA